MKSNGNCLYRYSSLPSLPKVSSSLIAYSNEYPVGDKSNRFIPGAYAETWGIVYSSIMKYTIIAGIMSASTTFPVDTRCINDKNFICLPYSHSVVDMTQTPIKTRVRQPLIKPLFEPK